MKKKTEFTTDELLTLGFEPILEGGYRTFQLCFDKSEYFTSGALITSDLRIPDYDPKDSTFTVQLSGVRPERNLNEIQIKMLKDIYEV